MSGADPPRTGAWARGAMTSVAAARVGLAQLGQRMRPQPADAQERAALQAQHDAHLGRILYQTLGQLRGTALKVSQLLSMEVGFLPEGIRQELARACHQVTPLNRALVGRVFRQSFGQEPEALFTQFEPHAFAAASLGQVHRAQLAGHGSVAVKVQYPGIASTIASDMRLLRTALQAMQLGGMALPHDTVVERTLADIEATLLREVDYRQEAEQLQWFATHAQWPGVVIPHPIASHSSAQVLTQPLLQGMHLANWLRTNPPQAARNTQGQRLFDWFMHTAFRLGRVQSDLHPGNVLFLHDGQLGLLDFGCTRQLSGPFVQGIIDVWRIRTQMPAAQQGLQLAQAYQTMGLLSPQLAPATFAQEVLPQLAPLLDWQVQALRGDHFDFCTATPLPHPSNETHRALVQHMVGMPPDFPAFERAWFGLMHLLTQMQAQVRTYGPWNLPAPALATQTDTTLRTPPTQL